MRHILVTLLAAITLLSQWGWLEHDYHDHDPDEVCEVCVSASGHIAVTPSTPPLPNFQSSDFVLPTHHSSLSTIAPRFYASRAPPVFSKHAKIHFYN